MPGSSHLIASRYLFSRKGISLVSTLTYISIAGVTIGTALLIVVLSVFNGFFDVIKSMLLSNDPDLRIESAEDRHFIFDDNIESVLNQIPEIAILSPYVQGKALLAHRGGRDQVVVVKGIHPERFARYADLDVLLSDGKMDLSVRDGRPGVLLSEPVAQQLRVFTGDEISLLSAAGMQRALTQFSGPRASRFAIRGTYSLHQVIDEPVIYVDIQAAQRLFNQPNRLSGIDISLVRHEEANKVKNQLETLLGDAFIVQTWYDLQKPLYDVMNLEKWGAYFILMIIVLVAVLNIVGSLTMVVIQKKRDIGLLRSIGYRKKDIMNIFLRQGWYIGLIGCLLGGAAGLALVYAQGRFELVKLAGAESFIISAYPVQLYWPDVFLVLGASLTLCVLASWYPAWRASSIQPADAVRNE
ncbi:FtsX-like permease family protein [Balneolaceae bacterium ANBcel3]|nr:FtsX-like permease family protein [Balneolaceae bacterium ANBcel3]